MAWKDSYRKWNITLSSHLEARLPLYGTWIQDIPWTGRFYVVLARMITSPTEQSGQVLYNGDTIVLHSREVITL